MVGTIEPMVGFLSPTQAATRLGVSEATLRGWSRRGQLAALMTPIGRLYPVGVIEQLARERAAEKETTS